MHHGCYHLCPKVREQLQKARIQAGEELKERVSSSDSDLSVVAGPSKVQQSEATSKRSKESRKLPARPASPTKIVKSPRRSHESAYRQDEQYPSGRVSPTKSATARRKLDPESRSQRRSKESQRTKGDPSRHESPVRSPEASRKFDLEKRSQGRSKDSQKTRDYLSSHGSPNASVRFGPDAKSHPRSQEPDQKSYRSILQEQKVPEYKSEASIRTNGRDKTPQPGPSMKGLKKGQRRGREFDDGAGSSGKRRGDKDDEEEFEDYEESFSAHDLCDSHCLGINERMRKLRDENQQQALDEYLVYKGLPYFGDLCTCCCQCFAKQLWNDHFVNTTVASAALFAVGLKLCSDLNGWTVPNVF